MNLRLFFLSPLEIGINLGREILIFANKGIKKCKNKSHPLILTLDPPMISLKNGFNNNFTFFKV
jgi:hypothetical protein